MSLNVQGIPRSVFVDASRRGSDIAIDTLRRIDRSYTTVVRVSEDEERVARNLLRTYRDMTFSLTDALSFVVMDGRRISTAFSFDDDFGQHGFATL